MESGIQGMADRAHARHGVVNLEVSVSVPGDRGDALSFLESKFVDRISQLPGSASTVAIGVSMQRVVGRNRDDFAIRVVQIRMPQNHRNEQRGIHHQALHFCFSLFCLEAENAI
jgi:hypothetical protein